MAGIRHHILPRFLLKGFASKTIPRGAKQDEVFTWVYRKGAATPFEANITKVGVEKHFYGKDGELNVDDEITGIEGEFAAAIDALRKQDDGYKVTDENVIGFVVHLTSRTKHLRDTFIDAGEFLADNLFGYFSDYDNWKAWCIEHFKRHPEVIKNALDEVIPKLPLSAYKKALVRQRIKKMPIERIMAGMDEEQSQYEFMFQSLRLKLLAGMNDIAKQSHIKALLKGLVSEPRLEHYRRLHWYVRKSNVPLILGDVGCLFELEGEDRYKSLGGASEKIRNVYLPLTSDLMMVGAPIPEAPSIDFAAINEVFAMCSRDFFVCSVSTPEMARLANLLGEEADMITKEEMEQTITELIAEP